MSQPQIKSATGPDTRENADAKPKSDSQASDRDSSPSRSKVLFSVVIPGRVAIKKNSKRIVSFGGRKAIISSSQYLAWERVAIQHLRMAWGFQKHLECPLTLNIKFYFKNRQSESDLDNCIAGPKDSLQLAGVIANDKQIIRISAEKFFGEQPRTEIELREYVA